MTNQWNLHVDFAITKMIPSIVKAFISAEGGNSYLLMRG
jgi:hypothetical protein